MGRHARGGSIEVHCAPVLTFLRSQSKAMTNTRDGSLSMELRLLSIPQLLFEQKKDLRNISRVCLLRSGGVKT